MNTNRLKTTHPSAATAVRELDRRTNDGIDVSLLWSPRTNRVWVAVENDRAGESFELDVEPGEALVAFHHPYIYAPTAALASADQEGSHTR